MKLTHKDLSDAEPGTQVLCKADNKICLFVKVDDSDGEACLHGMWIDVATGRLRHPSTVLELQDKGFIATPHNRRS